MKEHDAVDEHLANTLAKVRMQAHQELIRYQEEAEQSYQHSVSWGYYTRVELITYISKISRTKSWTLF